MSYLKQLIAETLEEDARILDNHLLDACNRYFGFLNWDSETVRRRCLAISISDLWPRVTYYYLDNTCVLITEWSAAGIAYKPQEF